ncbi:MAG: SDR family NAD(P)-dependent oxidoreductase [Nevskia sp.]|nr:SDR family NAD(P)-dependent oxidoreductase [Nevskia sp.]
MSNSGKVWFITGISRGLGLELARAALARGDTVVGTTRSGASEQPVGAGDLHVLPLEVTDAAQVKAVVANAQAICGRLDVVVNNAGYGLLGAMEETAEEQYRHLFEVDFFAPVQVIKAALPFLRAQRSGCIVNISSIAGLAPMGGSAFYAAAKSALEGLSQSLAQELAPLGVKVMLVEPGAFRTDFLSAHSLRSTAVRIEDYAGTAGAVVSRLGKLSGHQAGDPARGAAVIMQAALSDDPPLHLVVGRDAIERARAKLQRLAADIDRWETVGSTTDFAEARA